MTVLRNKRLREWLYRCTRVVSVMLSAAVIGIGFGWAQGIVAFDDPSARAWNAVAAGTIAALLWPIMYFKVIRPVLSIESTCVIGLCAVMFGLIGATVTRMVGRWYVLPLSAGCLGMLLASISYFRRTESTSADKRLKTRIVEGACVLVCSFIVGCGEGWLQGLIVFKDFRERGFSGLAVGGDMGAAAGGGYAAILCPVVYFVFLRDRVNLQVVTKLIVMTLFSGVIAAELIGWGAAFVTLAVLVIVSPFVACPVAQQDPRQSVP